MKVIIVGGGASGFFTAINLARRNPDFQITLIEKTNKLLSKVKISGGGRCNVTNERSEPGQLIHFYPRGQKKLYKLFQQFSTKDMVEWLEKEGVPTHAEADHRVFPLTNSSQTIIDCFMNLAYGLKVKIVKNCGLKSLQQESGQWQLDTTQGMMTADRVVMCTGSSPSMWSLMEELGLTVVRPVPSLFTFNIRDERLDALQGISFGEAHIRVVGSPLGESGPLLITHWGLSGPVVLKLSSWGAREFDENKYQFNIMINFVMMKPDAFRSQLLNYSKNHPKRIIINYPQVEIPKRFWERICQLCDIHTTQLFEDLSKKQINKLTEELTQGTYQVNGKSTFKEEFVTAGGVDLSEVNMETFATHKYPTLYLAGEAINIDALTGGFNFQACWSAGWIIGQQLH